MRGVGGPLLTIGDLLSDLAVDGGDDPLVGVGDASVPSSPSAAKQAGKADPSDLSQLFEVRARFLPLLPCSRSGLPSIDPSTVRYLYTSPLVELIPQFGVEAFVCIRHSAVGLLPLPYGGRAAAAASTGMRLACWHQSMPSLLTYVSAGCLVCTVDGEHSW